jgi:hypothetical protein
VLRLLEVERHLTDAGVRMADERFSEKSWERGDPQDDQGKGAGERKTASESPKLLGTLAMNVSLSVMSRKRRGASGGEQGDRRSARSWAAAELNMRLRNAWMVALGLWGIDGG